VRPDRPDAPAFQTPRLATLVSVLHPHDELARTRARPRHTQNNAQSIRHCGYTILYHLADHRPRAQCTMRCSCTTLYRLHRLSTAGNAQGTTRSHPLSHLQPLLTPHLHTPKQPNNGEPQLSAPPLARTTPSAGSGYTDAELALMLEMLTSAHSDTAILSECEAKLAAGS